MRQCTDLSSNKMMIQKGNCPIFWTTPIIPGQTIKYCVFKQKLELHLPKTKQQPTFFHPSTEPSATSPVPFFSNMISSNNSFEQISISQLIQRKVAAVELTVDAGMDELIDKVSQVTVQSSSFLFVWYLLLQCLKDENRLNKVLSSQTTWSAFKKI